MCDAANHQSLVSVRSLLKREFVVSSNVDKEMQHCLATVPTHLSTFVPQLLLPYLHMRSFGPPDFECILDILHLRVEIAYESDPFFRLFSRRRQANFKFLEHATRIASIDHGLP